MSKESGLVRVVREKIFFMLSMAPRFTKFQAREFIFNGCWNMEETLEEIQGNYKLNQKEQVYTILAVKFRDMGLKTMMDSLFMHHIHNLKNKGIEIPGEPEGDEGRYIQ